MAEGGGGGPGGALPAPGGRYQLVQELGRGGQGVVYKAVDAATGGAVAVKKVPRPAGGRGGGPAAGLLAEVEALQGCEHPNVVRYLGHHWDATHLWIVLEYCAGGSLAGLLGLASEPLAEAQVAYVCREVLSGLAYLHARGKVHRDVKCSNILLTGDGRVKLGDLGVLQDARGSARSGGSAFLGTPHWVAPEVFQRDSSGREVDVWALGISVIEMVQHVPPYWDLHPMKVIFEISNGPPPAPARPGAVPEAVAAFIAACLEKDPERRPGAAELQGHPLLRARGGGELFREDIARYRGVLREMEPGPSEGRTEGRAAAAAAAPAPREAPEEAEYIDVRELGGHIRTVRGGSTSQGGVREAEPPPPPRAPEEAALAFKGPLPLLRAADVSADALLFPSEPKRLPPGAGALAEAGSNSAANLAQELEYATWCLESPGLTAEAAAPLARRQASCEQAVRALAALHSRGRPAG